MVGSILVPLDGSPLGERALPAATALARAAGARLVLVHAVDDISPGWPDVETPQPWLDNDVQSYLDAVADSHEKTGLNVTTALPHQRAAEGILSELSHFKADLIVMTTHGRSGLGRWIYGSVAEAVLAHSPVPVLLVRADAHRALTLADMPSLRALVALDGSAFAEVALPSAAEVVRLLGGALVLLRAVDPLPAADGLPEKEIAEARAYLDQQATRLAAPDLQVRTVVRVGHAVETILEESRAPGVGLVVMSTHGRTGLGRLMFGSVAMQVLRRGGHPVLVVRPLALQSSHGLLDNVFVGQPH